MDKSGKRLSRFVVSASFENGKTYYYSTENGNMITIDTELKNAFEDIVITNPGSELIRKLEGAGFLTDVETDEYKKICLKMARREYEASECLELTLLPTEKCNFRCVYCYEDFKSGKMSDATANAIVRYVDDNIDRFKGLSVAWFGGEPLLEVKRVISLSEKLIEICKKHKKSYLASMTTNGYLLSANLFKKLIKCKIYHYQITIDGEKVTHDRQRKLISGEGSFDTIIANLSEIKSNNNGRGLWTISLRTNVTIPMLPYLRNYLERMAGFINGDRRFSLMIRKMWGNNTEEADRLLVDNEAFETVMKEIADSVGILSSDYQFTHDLGYRCYAAKPHSLVVRADGRLAKCTLELDSCIGRIEEDGTFNVDENKLASFVIPDPKRLAECSECSFFAACGGNYCPVMENTSGCKNMIDTFVRSELRLFSNEAKSCV
nr:radical SAM protein [Lachnospiraceae bacterium]